MSGRGEDPFDKFERIMDSVSDLAEGAETFLDDHGDSIRSLTGEVDQVDLTEGSLLKDARVRDSVVEIILEGEMEGIGSIGLETEGQKLRVNISGGELEVKIPDDAEIENAESKYKNGILTLKIPRGGEVEWD